MEAVSAIIGRTGAVRPNFPQAVISALVRQNAHKDHVGGRVFC